MSTVFHIRIHPDRLGMRTNSKIYDDNTVIIGKSIDIDIVLLLSEFSDLNIVVSSDFSIVHSIFTYYAPLYRT